MLQKLLLFFCLFLPFQFALSPQVGVDLAVGRVLALVIFGLWLWTGLKNKTLPVPANLQTWLLGTFLFFCVFSLAFSHNLVWSVRKLLFLLSFFPLYLVVAANKIDSQKIIKFLVYGASLAASIGIAQFLSQFIFGLENILFLWRKLAVFFLGGAFSQAVLEYSSWLVNLSGRTVFRAVAFFPDPHMFSLYLGMCLPFALGLYFSARKKIFLFFSVLILLADLLTFSRGGYLGLLTGLVLAILFSWKKIRPKQQKIIIALVILCLIFIILPSPISQRFFSSFNAGEGSNAGRLETWQESLRVIENNPLGVGLGNYSLEIKPSANYREPIYSHNLYFDIAAETGILNALLWITLLLTAILAFLRSARAQIFYLSGAVSLLIFVVHSIFETALFSVHILPLLIIILAFSNHRPIENKKAISTTSCGS